MNEDTLLLRQVHPSFVQADHVSAQAFSVTSQVFKPTPKDEQLLSVYNGEKFTAEKAYDHYTATGDKKSVGVLAVTPIECAYEKLRCAENNDPFDGHAYIDFKGLPSGQMDQKAKKLKKAATNRGWLFSKL